MAESSLARVISKLPTEIFHSAVERYLVVKEK
jgi:hypothetical protein